MKFLINFNLFSLNANCFLTQCDVSQLVAIHIHFVDEDRIVDSHIKNIRKKLNADYIKTIRGVGYRIDKVH